MSIANLRYWEPQLDLSVHRGFPSQVIPGLRDRVISYELEDDHRLIDKASLVLDNSDGKLLDLDSMALGLVMKASLGYPGAMSTPRLMECRKITGSMRIGGLGAMSGDNTAAGGAVNLELRSQVWGMNIFRSASKQDGDPDRQLTFTNATIPEIVRALACRRGFAGTSLLVSDLDDEPRHATYTIPTKMSDAEWVQDQAKRRRWTFAIDGAGFHFHPPGVLKTGEEMFEDLSWFAGEPDVIEWDIDGDLNVPQHVLVKGTDKELAVGAAQGEALQGGSSPGVENTSGETTVSAVRSTAPLSMELQRRSKGRDELLGLDALLSVPNPNRRQREAIERLANRALNRWTLKLTLVGNPRVHARMGLNLRNFGPLVDGKWWVKKSVHSYKAGQVYITEVEAKRKAPKSSPTVAAVGAFLGPTVQGSGVREATPISLELAR